MFPLFSGKFEYYRDLISLLVARAVKLKYKSSALGFFWSLLFPLAQAVVFFIAFVYIFRIQIENYIPFLLTGLFTWQWCSSSLTSATSSLVYGGNLIRYSTIPREFVVLSGVLSETIHFLLAQGILWIFLIIQGIYPAWRWLELIPAIFLTVCLLYGLALVISAAAVFFRDTLWLMNLLLNVGFYATPVLYPVDMIPDPFQWVFGFNPLAGPVVIFRHIYLGEAVPDWFWISFPLWTLLSLAGGSWFFSRVKWYFAEAL